MQSDRRLSVLSCAVAATVAALTVGSADSLATVAFDGSTTYTQNFDNLTQANSTSSTAQRPWVDDTNLAAAGNSASATNSLLGWYLQQSVNVGATSGNYQRLRANGAGSFGNTGGVYSYGPPTGSPTLNTNRALGILESTTVGTEYIALRLQNTSDQAITGVTLNYTGEQFWVGSLTSNQSLTFGYKVGAGSMQDPSFTTVSGLSFTSPKNATSNGAGGVGVDGTSATYQTAVGGTITGLNWQPGQDLWLRWQAPGPISGSHGLALDNLSLSGTLSGTPSTTADPTWKSDAGGTWDASDTSNWLNAGLPTGTGGKVRLGSQLTGDRTVTLATSPTVDSLEFNGGAHNYTLAATGGNQLNVAAGGSIVVNGVAFNADNTPSDGNQITAPLNFATNASFRVNDPLAKLTVTGNITVGSGGGLTLGGAGAVVLPASFTNWSGPTSLDGPNITVSSRSQLGDGSATNSLALSSGSTLTVTADMTIGDLVVGPSGGTTTAIGGAILSDNNVTLGAVTGTGLFAKRNAGTTTVTSIRTGGLYIAAVDRTGNITGGALRIAPSGGADSSTSVIKFLRIESQSNGSNGFLGQLDITDNKLIVDWDPSQGANPLGKATTTGLPTMTTPFGTNQPASRIAVALWQAYASGHWTGGVTNPTVNNPATGTPTPVPNVGITSSLAQTATADPVSARSIGYADAARLLGLSGTQTATWGGQTVDASSILVRYTWGGDANLDGKIDADDYVLVDRGFLRDQANGNTTAHGSAADAGLFDTTHSQWQDGDFNYDSIVSAADYLIIDRSFLATHPGSPEAARLLAQRQGQFGDAYVSELAASVPEPTMLSLVGLGALPLLSRRQRRVVR